MWNTDSYFCLGDFDDRFTCILCEKIVLQSKICWGFSALGKGTMVIMFLHQPIQLALVMAGVVDKNARFVMAVSGSIIIYRLFLKFSCTRALFLGSKADFKKSAMSVKIP